MRTWRETNGIEWIRRWSRGVSLWVVGVIGLAGWSVPNVNAADKWPVVPHPHLDVLATYDDNVFVKPSGERADFYFTISPGLELVHGDKERNWVRLDYTASVLQFVRLTSEDTVNHLVSFGTHVGFDKLDLNLSHGFRKVTGADVEVSDRIERRENITQADAEYTLSPKTSVGLHYRQEFQDFASSGQIDYQIYEAGGALYYRMWPKTDLFGEFNYGWVNVERGTADAEYQEGNVGVRLRATGKTVGTAKVGYQHRDFRGALDDMDSLVASLNIVHDISEWTAVELVVVRAINPSITSTGNSYTATKAGVSLRQKLHRGKILLSLGGAYEHDDYDQRIAGETRQDDYWEISAGADYNMTKWLQVGARYTHRSNHSTLSTVGFDQNLVTLHARVHF